MSNPVWKRRKLRRGYYWRVRVVEEWELDIQDDETFQKIELIYDALEWSNFIIFEYDGRDRLVAPFVIGLSSDGNALIRGYQVDGGSRSGKGAGWRVFQVKKIDNLDQDSDFFNPEDFHFQPGLPWIYKVFKEYSGEKAMSDGLDKCIQSATQRGEARTKVVSDLTDDLEKRIDDWFDSEVKKIDELREGLISQLEAGYRMEIERLERLRSDFGEKRRQWFDAAMNEIFADVQNDIKVCRGEGPPEVEV